MPLRFLLASALAVVVLLCAACGGGSDGSTTSTAAGGSLAPLSTLGKLQPAPALGKPGGELVGIPNARALAPAASQATASHDVDGIKTTDPRLVPGAYTIPAVSYWIAAEMALLGAKVLHPRSVQPAARQRIPVRIASSHVPDRPGGLAGA